jgi:hypothetical protein
MKKVRIRFDDDDETRDGESVRVPLLIMDGARHAPGFVQLTDDYYIARRRAARDAYIRDLSSAWDGRKRRREPEEPDEDELRREADRRRSFDFSPRGRIADAAQFDLLDARRRGAWYGMCARLQDAWKTPTRDWGQPDQGSTPAELAAHNMRNIRNRPDENENLVRGAPTSGGNVPSPGDREKMYAQRNRDLENAWRSPSGVAPLKPTQIGAGPAAMVMRGRTDPSRAGQIENQRERWLGK